MNIKNNQRYQQTENDIKAVFIQLLKEKSVNRITVSELCQKAQINRKTFYKHYLDVYDLMEKMETDMGKQLAQNFVGQPMKSIGDGFARLFEFIKEHKDFYGIYLGNNSSMKVLDVILPEGYDARELEMAERIGFTDMREHLYHVSFFKAGLTAIVKVWLEGGCQESPEHIVQILSKEYNPPRELFVYDNENAGREA